jgi:hypothetical protein
VVPMRFPCGSHGNRGRLISAIAARLDRNSRFSGEGQAGPRSRSARGPRPDRVPAPFWTGGRRKVLAFRPDHGRSDGRRPSRLRPAAGSGRNGGFPPISGPKAGDVARAMWQGCGQMVDIARQSRRPRLPIRLQPGARPAAFDRRAAPGRPRSAAIDPRCPQARQSRSRAWRHTRLAEFGSAFASMFWGKALTAPRGGQSRSGGPGPGRGCGPETRPGIKGRGLRRSAAAAGPPRAADTSRRAPHVHA